MADVLTVHYNEDVLDAKGKPDMSRIKPLSFCANEYLAPDKVIGSYGFSVKKP